MSDVDVTEFMERASRFFRLGRKADGGLSLQVWFTHPDRGEDPRILTLIEAMERGDYLCVADVLDVLRESIVSTRLAAGDVGTNHIA